MWAKYTLWEFWLGSGFVWHRFTTRVYFSGCTLTCGSCVRRCHSHLLHRDRGVALALQRRRKGPQVMT